MRPFFQALLILAALSFSYEKQACASSLQDIPDGETQIDMNGDFQPEKIVKAWRENFNAHGFSILTILRQDGKKIDAVPFFDDGKEFDSVLTSEGADCVLKNYVFYKTGPSIKILKAERRLGKGYTDSQPVDFTVFSLEKNKSQEIGIPEFYFAASKNGYRINLTAT